jgi:hypothetical protein
VVVAERSHYVLSGIAAVVQWWGHRLEDGGSSGCIWGERVRRKLLKEAGVRRRSLAWQSESESAGNVDGETDANKRVAWRVMVVVD